jgi:hypothetical protein
MFQIFLNFFKIKYDCIIKPAESCHKRPIVPLEGGNSMNAKGYSSLWIETDVNQKKRKTIDRILTRRDHRACHTQIHRSLQLLQKMTDLFKKKKTNSSG